MTNPVFLSAPVKVLLTGVISISVACRHEPVSTKINPSPDGKISRYDLAFFNRNYAPAFIFSYGSDGRISTVYIKNGSAIERLTLNYTAGKLDSLESDLLVIQNMNYDPEGHVHVLNYTTLRDTGKQVYTYDAQNRLISRSDSVKQPLAGVLRSRYDYSYEGDNVTQVSQYKIDQAGKATLVYTTYLGYDDKVNPFQVFPLSRNASLLPGGFSALFNKNNVTTTRIASPDGVDVSTSQRTYQYNLQGYPQSCKEEFQDIQNNLSGTRVFNYSY